MRSLLCEGVPINVLGWTDSQVTHIERRLDKARRLRIGGAAPPDPYRPLPERFTCASRRTCDIAMPLNPC